MPYALVAPEAVGAVTATQFFVSAKHRPTVLPAVPTEAFGNADLKVKLIPIAQPVYFVT
jgi:hypothetical protein